MEIIIKIGGILKTSDVPFFLLSIFGYTKRIEIRKKKSVVDEAPGDNFPYIARTTEIY